MSRRTVGSLTLAVLACLLTACTSVVDGAGRAANAPGPSGTTGSPAPSTSAAPSGSTPPGFPSSGPGAPVTSTAPGPGAPSGSGTDAPPVTNCPTISYPHAHLRFGCVTSGLTFSPDDPTWPLDLQKPTEATWAMSEGAGHWGTTGGRSLQQIATNLRQQMLAQDPPAYGTDPGVRTTSSKAATVGGVPAWVLQTTFTINPAFREQRQLTVRTERSWIVALRVGADDVSVWYVTIPDNAKALWAHVPAVIAGISVI